MNHRWKLWGTAALIGVAALSFTGCSDRTGANLGRAIDGNSRGTYFEENTVAEDIRRGAENVKEDAEKAGNSILESRPFSQMDAQYRAGK